MKPIPLKPNDSWIVDEVALRGLAVRLVTLETHYRKPMDMTAERLNKASKTMRRWLSKAIPALGGPPLPILEALCDDLNTPQAIAELHVLAKSGESGELFRGLKFLGLLPGEPFGFDYGSALEIKTLPIDRIPIPQWENATT